MIYKTFKKFKPSPVCTLLSVLALSACGGASEDPELVTSNSTTNTQSESSNNDSTSAGAGINEAEGAVGSESSSSVENSSSQSSGPSSTESESNQASNSENTSSNTENDIAETSEETTDYSENVESNDVIAPLITYSPSSLVITEGMSTSLGVTAEGTDLNYQWYFNGEAIFGATESQLSLDNITNEAAGTYFCVVSNTAGSDTSSSAIISVADAIILKSVTVSWMPPTEREDGSTLQNDEIDLYRIYYGLASESGYSGTLDISGTLSDIVVEELETGEYKFAISTIDVSGLESALSEEHLIAIR